MVKTEIKYEAGHSCHEEWEKTDFHCLGCGEKSVWEDQNDGDYYVGPLFICEQCGASFTMQYNDVRTEDWQDKQRLEAIRSDNTQTNSWRKTQG